MKRCRTCDHMNCRERRTEGMSFYCDFLSIYRPLDFGCTEHTEMSEATIKEQIEMPFPGYVEKDKDE